MTAAGMSAVLYSSFLLSYLVGGPQHADFVSELERPGAPYAQWYRASDLIAGLLMLVIAALCWPERGTRPWSRWAVLAVAVVGACSILDGVSSMDCAPSARVACELDIYSVGGLLRQLLVGHTLSGLVGFIAAGVGAGCCARVAWAQQVPQLASPPPAGSPPGARRYPGNSVAIWWMRVHIVLAAGIGMCGLGDLVLLLAQVDVAGVERVRVVLVSLWVAVVPWTVHAVLGAHHLHITTKRRAQQDR